MCVQEGNENLATLEGSFGKRTRACAVGDVEVTSQTRVPVLPAEAVPSVTCLPNETVAVFKEYNVSRHFSTKYANYASSKSTQERAVIAERLLANLQTQQNVFHQQTAIQEMADPWQECMDFAVPLARKAGEVIREALTKEIAIMIKSSPADLVTVTDQKVENMIISSIKEKYPSHSFIGEESVAAGAGSTLTDNPTWIIDPIDGTTNFVHRFPFVAVSIGFVVKKQMEFGIVYSCVEDKMYTARKGKGAFCNGQKLQVSKQNDITKALLVSELGSNREPEVIKTVLANMQRLLSIPVHGIRAVGTAAVNMCLVATGGADAYYEMGIHCWDMAGAGIIITEAGGVLLDVSGKPFDLMSRRIIAANSQVLAERIAKEIQAIPYQRDDATN